MEPIKVILMVLLAIIYVAFSTYALKTNETTKKLEDGTEIAEPFTNKEKVFALIWSTAVALLVARTIIQWG